MSLRRILRDTARSALAAEPEFAGYTVKRSWAHGVDISELPAWGVFTPEEIRDPETTQTRRGTVDLSVVLKRTGGDDLEDLLDTEAEVIEAVVPPAIYAGPSWFAEVVRIRTDISAEGAKRVGTLQVTIRCVAEIEIID